MGTIAENVAAIRETMAAAARQAGREPGEILLCAATKMNDAETVKLAVQAGVDCCGENRVQELLQKQPLGAYEGVPVHFIGHLQTNKVNKVVGRAALIQSVDSTRLLARIDAAAEAAGLVQDVLLEINIGGEQSKSGVSPALLWPLLDDAAARPHLQVRGLMAIPPAAAGGAETRAFFAAMRELLAKAQARRCPNAPMDILSMGMSGDYLAAIREGATLVRIGTAIYGARDYSRR